MPSDLAYHANVMLLIRFPREPRGGRQTSNSRRASVHARDPRDEEEHRECTYLNSEFSTTRRKNRRPEATSSYRDDDIHANDRILRTARGELSAMRARSRSAARSAQ